MKSMKSIIFSGHSFHAKENIQKAMYFQTYIFNFYPRWAKRDTVHLSYLFSQPEFTTAGSAIKQQHFPHKSENK